jgi:DNA-binding NarL/FixJ family response regulator
MFRWFSGQKSITSLAKPLDFTELRKRVKIVVVDDDEHAFPIKVLQNEGYTIEQWPHVKSLDRLERGDFDIIVLDISGVATELTPLDGLGILQHLKDANPAQIVVAFSGQSFDLGKTQFFRLADDTLAKPVDALKCKQVLDQLIQTRFTVDHLWEGVKTILKKEKVSDKTIERLETEPSRAIKGGSRDYQAIMAAIIEKAEVSARLATIVAKIGTLCGL